MTGNSTMTDVWKPHATVAAIVTKTIEGEQRFLMVEELKQGQTVYNQPAGHLEPHESLLQAVIRETREETARDFQPEYISGIYRWDQFPAGGEQRNRCFLRVAFVGSCHQHNPEQALDDGILRALWLSRDELTAQPEKLRSPLVLRCIDDFLAGRRYPLELISDI